MDLSANYDSVNIQHMCYACLRLYHITCKLWFSIHCNLALAGYQAISVHNNSPALSRFPGVDARSRLHECQPFIHSLSSFYIHLHSYIHSISHHLGLGEVWTHEHDAAKFNQFGWRCTNKENSYSDNTLVGNWNERKFDIKEQRKAKPLPSSVSI